MYAETVNSQAHLTDMCTTQSNKKFGFDTRNTCTCSWSGWNHIPDIIKIFQLLNLF